MIEKASPAQPVQDEWEARSLRGVGPHPHDPRAFDVAARLTELIAEAWSGAVAEHIGSTAIAGIPGKGIVDLQIIAEPADIPALTEALLEIGFRRQTGRDPFPPSRPMLTGTICYDGAVFGLHCHIVPTNHPKVDAMLAFRDLLRRDPDLCTRYAALKQSIVATGTTDSYDYTIAKTDFIVGVLRAAGVRS